MAAQTGSSSQGSKSRSDYPLLVLLDWATSKIDMMENAEVEYINAPTSQAPEPTLWREWTILRKEDQPKGVWPARPKKRIAPFGVLAADTQVPPIRCKRLEIWLPQELDDEDLAAREALLAENLATKWVAKKRAVAVLIQRHFRRQGRRNLRLISWARKEKAAEEQRRKEKAAKAEAARVAREKEEQRLAQEEAARLEQEEEEERQRQEEADARLAAQVARKEAAGKATTSSLPVAEAIIDETLVELDEEETESDEEGPRMRMNIDEGAFADDKQIRKAIAAARKIEPTDKCPKLVFGPTNLPRFGDVTAWAKYLALGRKPFNSERPFHPEALADPAFRQRCREMGIAKLVELNEKGSIELTREIFANIQWRCEEKRALKFKVRGVVVSFTADAIDQFLEREEMEAAELRAQQSEWAAVNAGLPNDSPMGYEFIGELFAVDDTSVYKVGKNFKFIAWQHIQQAHRDLAPLLHLVQSSFVVNQHSTEVNTLIFLIIYKLLKKQKFSFGEVIMRDLMRMATNSRFTMGHVQLLTAMCREAGVPIAENECTIKPGSRIVLTGEFCQLLRIPIPPHCTSGTGTKRKATALALPAPTPPVQDPLPEEEEEDEDEIPLIRKIKAKTLAAPPAKKAKTKASAAISSAQPLLRIGSSRPPAQSPATIELPQLENEDMRKLGIYIQAMFARQEKLLKADVAVLATKLDHLQHELDEVKDVAEMSLLQQRSAAEEVNNRELPIFLTKRELARDKKGKGKARE